MSHPPSTIGVLGLGLIGSRIAEIYRSAGCTVHVWSRTPRSIAGFLPSPREVASASDIIQLFVLNGASLLDAIRDMAPVLTPRHLIVYSATVPLADTLSAASLVHATGAAFLDAPFTGSRDAAAAGQLVYYLGGSDEAIARARPLLEISSKEIIPFGAIGDATVLKLATNMVSAATLQVLAEAFALTAAAGVAPEKLRTALEGNANCSGLIRMKSASILSQDFTPHFSLKNMLKDARFAQDLAVLHHLDLPVHRTATQCMDALDQSGHGEKDFSVLASKYL